LSWKREIAALWLGRGAAELLAAWDGTNQMPDRDTSRLAAGARPCWRIST